jgi:hypothetical protein
MKKKLNTDSITNELEGASLFFTKPPSPPPLPEPEKSIVESMTATSISVVPPTQKESEKIKKDKTPKPKDSMVSRHHDTMTPRYQDTTTPQIHGVVIEIIRKAVKEFGKEAATHRFTEAEKKEIANLIFTYMNRGIKTSENEITRIAVNFIMEEYKVNGENSILHKILKALKE